MHRLTQRLMVTLLLTATLTLTACSLSPTAAVMQQLAKDPATVCFTATSIYGTVKLYRTATGNAAASCNENSLTVTPTKTP